ncbi:MAG: DUF1565 domain-containing protein, partial [Candidatus Marinimicrobia bacterium]|nr:DUF1565 domain-containing protein [Candidatus Neomarinimicrobiota bacterium]
MKRAIIIIILTICMAAVVSASVLYVDKNISDGFWAGSYTSLAEALNVSQSDDEIWVAAGTYTPGANRSDSFILKPGVKLYGGFLGGETNVNDRDVYANASILSGDIGAIANNSDNCYHVVSYNGTLTSTTVVDGFTIRDGNADNGSGGGGMLLENGAAPLIRNCKFVQNNTSGGGGAIYL